MPMLRILVASSLTALSLAATPAGAAVFEVGPAAAYTTVQSAIDAAILAGGDNEIRIQTGTYTEHVEIDYTLYTGSLRLVGGWDPGFASRSLDPTLTILDGNDTGRTLDVYWTGGSVALEGLTITGGLSDTQGAGLWVHPSSGEAVSFELLNCRIEGNHLVNESVYTLGAGLYLSANHSLAVTLADLLFTSNTIFGDGGEGAGLVINAAGTTSTTIRRVELNDNSIEIADGNGAEGAGASILLSSSATLLVDDLRVTDNTILGTTIFGNRGSGLQVGLLNGAQAELRRLEVRGNEDETTGGAEQMLIETFATSSVELSDSLAVLGSGGCVTLLSYETSTVQATNLTVADCPGRGLFLAAEVSGATSVTNSIVFDNGTNVDTDLEAALSTNLVGVDPMFLNAGGGDYRLQAASDGVGTGTASPVGGLGPKELDGGPRVVGTVDKGAYEYGAIFADGFESGDLSYWTTTAP